MEDNTRMELKELGCKDMTRLIWFRMGTSDGLLSTG